MIEAASRYPEELETATWSVDSSQVQQTYVATEEVLRWLSAVL